MCKDPSVDTLNQLGYNVVRLPRENIRPLDVLAKSGASLETLGQLADFVVDTGLAPPAIKEDQIAADISGLCTSAFEFNTGIKLLEKLLSYFGVGGLSLDVAFSGAASLTIEYSDVRFDSITPAKIGMYLTKATPDLGSLLIDSIDEEGEAYIITDILKSDSFKVIAHDKKGAKLDLNITALKALLDAHPQISVSKESNMSISFKGDKRLCFAMKAIEFWVEIDSGKGRFRLDKPSGPVAPMRAFAAASASRREVTPVLFGRNTLVRLR